MAMLITKFHRLIESRVTWGVILVVVVFSFVIWGMRVPGRTRQALEKVSPGKLYGEWVRPEEFRKAYFHSYLSLLLMVGQPFDTAKVDAELQQSAWRRLAALRTAEKMGLRVSDKEVLATIQQHPGFQAQGRFSPAVYNAFVVNMLGPLGISETAFEEHVRQEILIQKLRHMVEQAVLISPYEVQRAFSALTDVFTVELVEITTNDVLAEVRVAEEDVRARFEKNPAEFTLPDKVRVQYVALAVSNFLEGVTVSEDEALEYYNDHLQEFTYATTTTPVSAVATGEAAELAADMGSYAVTTTATRLFEEVKADILEKLRWEEARRRASERATDFVVSLAPDREGRAPALEEAAQKFGLELCSLPPFARDEALPEIEADAAFRKAAFDLALTPEDYFSDAIVGSNFVYVVALRERLPARIPEFEEVAEEVRRVAFAEALDQALLARAKEVRDAAAKALAEGRSFREAVEPQGLEIRRIENFTVSKDLEKLPHAEMLLRAILVRNQGEVTEPVPVEGGFLVAFVEKREPGDVMSFSTLRPQIVQSLRRDRQRALLEEWQSFLLRHAGFEERPKPEAVPEEEEEKAGEKAPPAREPLPPDAADYL